MLQEGWRLPLLTSLLSSCSPESKDRLGRLGHLKTRPARPSWRVYKFRAGGWSGSQDSVGRYSRVGEREVSSEGTSRSLILFKAQLASHKWPHPSEDSILEFLCIPSF